MKTPTDASVLHEFGTAANKAYVEARKLQEELGNLRMRSNYSNKLLKNFVPLVSI